MNMTILVVGANGSTGRLLVEQMISRGLRVKAIVRSHETLPESIRNHKRVSVICASILELSQEQLSEHAKGCSAVVSCLGHNLNLKGMYGKPRLLVTDSIRLLFNSIKANQPQKPIRFILMNTSGNRNPDLNEKISFLEKFFVALIRILLPPHVDNEKAANYLRTDIGQQNKNIEWVAIRPDSLINKKKVSEYEVYPSPIRSAIFNAGKTSRINVAHFMANLITDDQIWEKWKGQMPVIYNTEL